jgi:transcriptional regulator with XRE-family HTH domain
MTTFGDILTPSVEKYDNGSQVGGSIRVKVREQRIDAAPSGRGGKGRMSEGLHKALSTGGLGGRLRSRRRELGLSQADLAGQDLSASYVSLLEAGKRAPTDDVIATLADRLGVTAAFLISGEDVGATERVRLLLEYAELALHNGEAADALAQVRQVFAGDDLPVALQAQARRTQAKALELLGHLEEAVGEYERLAADAAASRQWEDQLRLTVDMIRCYREAGDVEHSLDLGREALGRVASLGLAGSDVHAQLASTLVGSYYVRGDLVKAAQLAAQAVREVESRGSALARASVYWNASVVAESANRVGDAVLLAEKALAMYAQTDDARAVARLRVAYAWLLMRSTPPDATAARNILTQAYDSLCDVGSAVDLAYCETELGRCWLLLGRPKSALKHADAAAKRLVGGVRLETAYAQLVRGAALLALERRSEAVEAYRAAARALGELDVARLTAGAWRELADAFTRLDLFQDAALAYQQALTEVGVRAAPGLLSEIPISAGTSRRARGRS